MSASITPSVGLPPTTFLPDGRALWLTRRAEPWVLAILTAVYFVMVYMNAERKTMYYDEFITYYIALDGRPGFTEFCTRIWKGPDAAPPTYATLTWLAGRLIINDHIALRLPSILGFYVCGVCVYLYCRKFISFFYVTIGLLFLLTSGAYDYAYEGRPYGVVLGGVGMALVFWERASHQTPRPWAWMGLALSLAMAFGCHYYSILVLIPLGIGEVVRTVETGRVNLSVWAAFLVASLSMLLFLPFISYSLGNFSANQRRLAIPFNLYMNIFYKSTVLFWIALCPLAIAYGLGRTGALESDKTSSRPPLNLIVVPAVLALQPFFVFFAVWVVLKKSNAERYSLPAVLGLVALIAFCSQQVARNSRMLGIIVTLLLLMYFPAVAASKFKNSPSREDYRKYAAHLRKSAPLAGVPILVPQAETYYRLHYYLPEEDRDRVLYPNETGRRSPADERSDGVSQYDPPQSRYSPPLERVDFEDFLTQSESFYVIFEDNYEAPDFVRDFDCKFENVEKVGELRLILLYCAKNPILTP